MRSASASEEDFKLNKGKERQRKHNKGNPQEELAAANSPRVMLKRNAVNNIFMTTADTYIFYKYCRCKPSKAAKRARSVFACLLACLLACMLLACMYMYIKGRQSPINMLW